MNPAIPNHGGDILTFQRRFPGRAALDFSANINPLGLPTSVEAALRDCGDASTHYPDPHCRELREALAGFEGVPPEWILCGNGASDLIYRIAWGLRPRRALVLAPTFREYEQALTAAGCRVTRYRLREEANFAPDASLVDAVDGADLVFLCNPNNPTGGLLEPALLEAVLERCAHVGAVLAVDECFLDFAENPEIYTLKRRLATYDRLLILRAFTKIFAMPGLRLGYALCSGPDTLTRLEQAGPPWSVSVPAQRCGVAAAGETGYLAETRRLLPGWRTALATGLEDIGFTVYPGAANYLFFRGEPGLAERLYPRGILIRDCSNFHGLAEGYYRTAVRAPAMNKILLETLRGL